LENKYWFGFRLKDGRSNIVLKGPYSYDKAMEAREQLKAPDADVSVCFVADSPEEALEKAVFHML
jgi:hypothetical protein